MRRKKHRKPMMDQRRMWRSEGVVRECEDWTVYFRYVQYVNVEANATASDVSEAKTIAISGKISKLNIVESAVCGYRPKKGINITRRCVNGYSITAAPAKSVTHMSF